MAACEVCWGQAHFLARTSGRAQVVVYHELLAKSAWHTNHPELADKNPLAVIACAKDPECELAGGLCDDVRECGSVYPTDDRCVGCGACPDEAHPCIGT